MKRSLRLVCCDKLTKLLRLLQMQPWLDDRPRLCLRNEGDFQLKPRKRKIGLCVGVGGKIVGLCQVLWFRRTRREPRHFSKAITPKMQTWNVQIYLCTLIKYLCANCSNIFVKNCQIYLSEMFKYICDFFKYICANCLNIFVLIFFHFKLPPKKTVQTFKDIKCVICTNNFPCLPKCVDDKLKAGNKPVEKCIW